jgi:hypothetical protein
MQVEIKFKIDRMYSTIINMSLKIKINSSIVKEIILKNVIIL